MEINNLIDNVRTFFTDQYQGVKKSSSYLSFEPLGCVVDPDDFKGENEEISNIKAVEQLSILGDRLPEIEPIFFSSTNRLSSVYEELIESANYTGSNISAEDQTPYISKFGEVKSESLLKFKDGQKASINTPEDSYLPVYAYPKNWYDPNGFFWVRKSFSSKDEYKQPEKIKSKRGIDRPIPLMWKSNLHVNPESLKILSKEPSIEKKVNLTAVLNAGVPHIAQKDHKKQELIKGNPFIFNKKLKSFPGIIQPAVGIKTETLKPQVQLQNLQVDRRLMVADRLKINNVMVNTGTSEGAPVKSNEFSMSFDYNIVYLERPWFSTSLFHYSKLWYCLSLDEGYFSNGLKDPDNSGVLKSIPTAMILIKDLRITAAWTNEDKQNAENSYGLGIFNTSNLKFNNNELIIPGMQIIGWICEVPPKIPAMGDPYLR